MSQLREAPPTFMRWQDVRALVGPMQARVLVARVRSQEQCREALRFARRNGMSVCPRGGGYSYGDAILNADNLVLDISSMNRVIEWDDTSGIVVVEPGATLIDMQKLGLPHRFVLSSVPSEPTITIAGAAAANVNGKDGARVGNFGDQVVQFKLMTADGQVVTASRSENADVFFAAIGGMGLLGVFVEITLQLKRIPSPFIHVYREPLPNLSALLTKLKTIREQSDHAVVWLDSCASGSRFGRGVIHYTRWLEDAGDEGLEDSIAGSLQRLDSRRAHADSLSPIVARIVSLMMNFQTLSVGMFNKLYFRYCQLRTRLGTADNDESIIRYSFDASFLIPSASAVCGPNGYTIQLTVPETAALEAIGEMLETCQRSPCFPAKLIMRLHRRDQYLVSFCEDGYSLNFEFHPKPRQIASMKASADELIATTIRHGGKVHLAKDHILSRSQFQALYPGYSDLAALKRRLDPAELFQSDLYRRLIRDRAAASLPEEADSVNHRVQTGSA